MISVQNLIVVICLDDFVMYHCRTSLSCRVCVEIVSLSFCCYCKTSNVTGCVNNFEFSSSLVQKLF